MYQGQVQYTNPKNQWGRYSFRLAGDQMYYNTETDPAPLKGKMIAFEGEQRGERSVQVDEDSIEIKGDAPPVRNAPARKFAPKKGAFRSSSNFADKEKYWQDREARDIETQKRIEIQSCRNSALTFLGLLVQTGALDLSKAKPAARAGLVEELLNTYQAKFLEENKGTATPAATPEEPTAEAEDNEGWEHATGDWE